MNISIDLNTSFSQYMANKERDEIEKFITYLVVINNMDNPSCDTQKASDEKLFRETIRDYLVSNNYQEWSKILTLHQFNAKV